MRIGLWLPFMLVAGCALAVLAFGGMHSRGFALAQILLFAAAILSLLRPGPAAASTSLPLLVPGLLAGLVVLQLVPLPGWLLPWLGSEVGPGGGWQTITVDFYGTTSGLLLLATYLTGFFLAIRISRDREGFQRIVWGLLAIGVFEALYGLVQYLTGWQYIFAMPKIYWLNEATGTYINRNHFAGLLEMILPFAMAMAVMGKINARFSRRRRRSAGPSSPGDWIVGDDLYQRLFWLLVATLLFVAVFYSRSRMGIMSVVVSVMALFCLMVTSGLPRRRAMAMFLVFVLVGGGLLGWLGVAPVLSRVDDLGRGLESFEEGRLAIWQDTLRLLKEASWLGYGYGSFGVAYTRTQTTFVNMFVAQAHNDYLQFGVEIGIVGAVVLFGSIFFLLGKIGRRFYTVSDKFGRWGALGCFGSILAILCHSLTDFNLQIPANALVFSVVLGMGYAVTQWEGPDRAATSEARTISADEQA